MKLILVRHGETDWNAKSKILSRTDIELNKNGKKQAKIVAKKLKKENFDLIYSSTLKRALQTAEEINKYHKLEIKKTNLLFERDFGDFEGTNYNKLDLREIRDNHLYKKYNMEKPEIFEKRITDFIEKYCCKKHGKTILIVAHSGTLKMILYHLLKIKTSFEIFRKQVQKNNTSISTIEFDEKFNITNFQIGNEDHLI